MPSGRTNQRSGEKMVGIVPYGRTFNAGKRIRKYAAVVEVHPTPGLRHWRGQDPHYHSKLVERCEVCHLDGDASDVFSRPPGFRAS